MLSVIGFLAICYVAVKYWDGILLFAAKTVVVLIGLYFLASALIWIFGASLSFHLQQVFMSGFNG
jgi:hypothetical protein|tara:strand:+ start:586 stop:780 length:195 start_codon:yes stop_codon:yes gene_type:complete